MNIGSVMARTMDFTDIVSICIRNFYNNRKDNNFVKMIKFNK